MRSIITTIKFALRSLRANIGRSLLTMLGIIIGVAAVIIISSVGSGAESLLTGSISKVGTKNIAILPGAADDNGPPAAAMGIVTKTFTMDDLEVLSRIGGVAYINPQVSGSFTTTIGSVSLSTSIDGVGTSYLNIGSEKMSQGRFFNTKEEGSFARVVVLGYNIVEEFEVKGKIIGEKIKIGNEKYKVIGILEKKGAQLFGGSPDDKIVMPYTTAQKRLFNINYLNFGQVQVEDEDEINIVMEKIRKRLRALHGIKDESNDDFSVRSIAQALDLVGTITGGLSLFLTLIAGISLLVGGIGIMNIMLMNVRQRTKEIGLRKAIGAKPRSIQFQFLIESMVLTILGGMIGTFLGILVSWGISQVAVSQGYEWVFVISSSSILLGLGISGITGLVFGFRPAQKAARLNAIDALRYE